MHHDVIRMQAEQHVRQNGIVENAGMILSLDVAYGQRTGITAHAKTSAFRDSHEPAKERPFAEIILR